MSNVKADAAWTTSESNTWNQRIRKEEAVNAKTYTHFSMRASVNNETVPTQFKPGHLDPRTAQFDIDIIRNGGSYDPAETGLPETMVKAFRRILREQKSGPRQRSQFFETNNQELGWCLSDANSLDERSQPSGSKPGKLGIGWIQHDGHGGLLLGSAGAHLDFPEVGIDEDSGWARPLQPKKKDVKEALGVGPYARNYDRAPVQGRLQTRGGSSSQARRHRQQWSHSSTAGKENCALQRRSAMNANRHSQRPESAPRETTSRKCCGETEVAALHTTASAASASQAARDNMSSSQDGSCGECRATMCPTSSTAMQVDNAGGLLEKPGLIVVSKGNRAAQQSLPAEQRSRRPQSAGAARPLGDTHQVDMRWNRPLTAPASCAGGAEPPRRNRPASAPLGRGAIASAAGQAHQVRCQDKAIESALAKSRCFLNGSSFTRQNSYFHPISSCNESKYADAYTHTWKKGLYYR